MESDIERLFRPDAMLVKSYQERLGDVLRNPAGAPQRIIELGELPAVYRELGIKDKELKMNNKTVVKALGIDIGIKDLHLHNVPFETMENLLTHLYNPEGVFKSLSTSKNPNSYIAILGAKSIDGKPIIAILSPSKNDRGFTFIPSVYEKDDFDKFVQYIHKEGKVLYIRDKGSELWGRTQCSPLHNSKPYKTRILTREDIVKRVMLREREEEAEAEEIRARREKR
ncbi:MAG: hypothetical protein LBD07_02645, partial [Spirochaetaceae bacterium]|nr:hypothetical protein [Spirochaetaceae bacterium]